LSQLPVLGGEREKGRRKGGKRTGGEGNRNSVSTLNIITYNHLNRFKTKRERKGGRRREGGENRGGGDFIEESMSHTLPPANSCNTDGGKKKICGGEVQEL